MDVATRDLIRRYQADPADSDIKDSLLSSLLRQLNPDFKGNSSLIGVPYSRCHYRVDLPINVRALSQDTLQNAYYFPYKDGMSKLKIALAMAGSILKGSFEENNLEEISKILGEDAWEKEFWIGDDPENPNILAEADGIAIISSELYEILSSNNFFAAVGDEVQISNSTCVGIAYANSIKRIELRDNPRPILSECLTDIEPAYSGLLESIQGLQGSTNGSQTGHSELTGLQD